jgi:putative peptide zinc metalloprotease protein
VAEQQVPAKTTGAGRLVLILPDGRRVPIDGAITIGRGDDATVRINDQTVSRVHATITPGPDGPVLEDAGSRFGTLLAGDPLTGPTTLHDGSTIRLGDVVVRVESDAPAKIPEREISPEAGETVVVPVDATLLGLRPSSGPAPSDGSLRPKLRSGWALKRMGADEGEKRFVLRDLRGGTFFRMNADEAALLDLLDGKHTVVELLAEAERTIGPEGPSRLARLVASLSDRGLLDGIGAATPPPERESALKRAFKPRERSFEGVGDYFQHAYRSWGKLFFSPLTVTFLVLYALAGFGAFTYLIGARYGTPFVVANRLLIGGLVFVLGRFAIVAIHEQAHGLALAHYGRRVPRGGVRLYALFPFAYVDTSESYFETRWNRIVISAAGPACDLVLGATFAFACAVAPKGAIRDVFFQLAFGAYIWGFFNLNPFIERDGYNILVDFLREPRLRQRARQQFAQKLSGTTRGERTSPVLGRYALAGLIWTVLAAVVIIIFATRYYDRFSKLIPHGLLVTMFIVFIAVLFLPVLMQVGLPIARRIRYGTAEVNRVIR